jgi:hypothetical protein
MHTKILIVFLIVTILASCKKDQYTTAPQLTFNSVNSTSLQKGNLLTFEIGFTDKEGDVQDTMWIQRISKICPSDVSRTIPYPIPNFTAVSYLKGVFEVSYAYNLINAGYPVIGTCVASKNDTSYFRFWIKDLAGHTSDTISSPNITFQK